MEKLKSAPRDFPKVGFKILRTTVGAGGGAGGRENGAFGTEIFRRIRQERSRRAERGGSAGQRPPAETFCYNNNNNNLMIIPNWGVIPPIFITSNIINTKKKLQGP